jgi:chromatin segregation and condensation protein Rec8/ScpA/Scc1 (kleisin family)
MLEMEENAVRVNLMRARQKVKEQISQLMSYEKRQFQDKYDEIFQNLKEEKMNWDFDDFLKKAEGNEEFRKMITGYPD